jgi:hypothetical protein
MRTKSGDMSMKSGDMSMKSGNMRTKRGVTGLKKWCSEVEEQRDEDEHGQGIRDLECSSP